MSISLNLSLLRKHRGFSRKQIADQLGVGVSMYGYYETEKNEISPIKLARIADYIDIPIQLFFDKNLTQEVIDSGMLHEGQRLKSFRLSENLTTARICASTGINEELYKDIELGKKSFSAELLKKIIKDFNANPLFILFGELPLKIHKNVKSNYELSPNLSEYSTDILKTSIVQESEYSTIRSAVKIPYIGDFSYRSCFLSLADMRNASQTYTDIPFSDNFFCSLRMLSPVDTAKINSGDVIFLCKLDSFDFINDKTLYMFRVNRQYMIEYIRKDKETQALILLDSNNNEVNRIPIEPITEAYEIRAIVKYC